MRNTDGNIRLVLRVLTLFFAFAAVPVHAEDITGQVIGPVCSYLPLAAQHPQTPWVLIQVTPDPLSGFAAPGGAVISGSYAVVQTLGDAVTKQGGTYRWRQNNGFAISAFVSGMPLPEYTRWLESSLFAYPQDGQVSQGPTNTLLCLLHEDVAGQGKFTSIHFVPDNWRKDVLPAVAYLRAHPSVTDAKIASVGKTEASELLHSSNPYLALTAMQLLASYDSLTTADMDTVLSSADIKVIASGIVIAELYSWHKTGNNAQWLKDKMAAVRSLNQLEGMAFGVSIITPHFLDLYAISAEDLPGVTRLPELSRSGFGASLVPLVRRKLTELDPNGGPADERWRSVDKICRQSEAETQRELRRVH